MSASFGIGILFIFLFFLLVFGAVFFGLRARPKKRQMSRKMPYVFFSAYVVILLIATITVSIMDKTSSAEFPRQLSDAEANQIEQALFNSILNKERASIDPSLILENRTHQAEDTLRLTKPASDRFAEFTSIYIERKSEDDGMIEETIYKPSLIINDLDFSDRLQYALPEWQQDEVVFRSPPTTEIEFSSYQDAYLLSQFTKKRSESLINFSSMSRQITIHLLVPSSTEIEADDSLMITYLEE